MKVTNDKREDIMTKFGAILANGILNAGWLIIVVYLSYN
jgi:hypothetical protein